MASPMATLLLVSVKQGKPFLQRIHSAFLFFMDELMYFLPEIPAAQAPKLGLYRHPHEAAVAVHSLFQVPAAPCQVKAALSR